MEDEDLLVWEDLTALEKQVIKRLSERSFERFVGIWFQLIQGDKFRMNWHHRWLCHEMEQVIKGQRTNTIFNVTPDSGKTEICSIHFPTYGIVNTRKMRNLNISFADSLVKRNSKRVREILSSKEFTELWSPAFGTSKDDELQVLNEKGKVWAELISKAAGGQITGSRGGYIGEKYSGCIMLDDIDKPDDMFSKVKRERIHMLLKNTIRSRRAKKSGKNPTPIIAIQQRLHAQDSTWFMTQGSNGKPGLGINFDVIKIPALVTEEYGKSLPDWVQPYFEKDVLSSEGVEVGGVVYYSFWPDNESIHDLLAMREADPYTFASQYMQEPMALGGSVFNMDWWKFYGDDPDDDEPEPDRYDYRFITADTAQKTKEINDFSVFIEWGKKGDKLYFIDGWRGKVEAPELEARFIAFVKGAWLKNKEKGTLRKVYVEDKASGTGLIQSAAKKIPLKIEPVQRSTDKVTRAMDAQPSVKAGKVVIPREHDLINDFLVEHASFTYDDTHKHDDIVDNTLDAVNFELNVIDDPVARMKRLAGVK